MFRVRTLRARILLLGAAFEGGLLLLAMLLGWLFGLPLWSLSAPTWEGTGQGLLAVAPMLVLLVATAHFPVGPLREIRDILDESLLPYFRESKFGDLALVALLAGLGEELLFRGVLQVGLAHYVGLWTAVALASLLFGLAHAITPTYAVLAGGVGVYFGAIFGLTESLYVVVLAHAVYDLIALEYLLRVHARNRAKVEEPNESTL